MPFEQAILKGVRNGSLDLGVVSVVPPKIQALRRCHLYGSILSLWGHLDTHCPAGPCMHSARCEVNDLLLPVAPNAGRRVLDDLAGQNGIQIQDVLWLDDADSVMQAVLHGYGITAIAYPTAVRRIAAEQLSLLRVEGFPARQVWHLVHTNRRLPDKVNSVKIFSCSGSGAALR